MNNKDYIDIANKNEIVDNISIGSVKFAHRYSDKKDVEVSGLFASWLSYGNREEYEKVVERLLICEMGNKPYDYVMSREYDKYKDNYTCLYHLTTWHNFAMLCNHLYNIYSNNEDLESAVINNFKIKKFGYYYQALCDLLYNETLIQSPYSTSACGRINMYLRWMSRSNSPIDLGIWTNIRESKLLVSCNDKVINNAKKLNLIKKTEDNKINMIKITKFANEVFKGDPSRMDYVLQCQLPMS